MKLLEKILMIVKYLMVYDDPNDITRPPRLKIYKWSEINVSPQEWYDILKNVKGNVYFRV